MEQWLNGGVKVPISTKWGNTYISPHQNSLSYKTPFKEPPFVIMDIKGESTDSCWLMKTQGGDSTKTPRFYLVRGDILTQAAQFNISVYATGKWK